MQTPSFLAACAFLAVSTALPSPRAAAEPLYENSFDQAAPGQLPEGFMVLSGGFAVKEEGGNRFLELPGSPLDTFGFLFGTAPQGDATASALFFGTRQGRKFPTFGISLGGVGGYRLQVSPAKKALEIFKGDLPQTSVPFEWQSGAWTHLRLRVRRSGDGSRVEGKAWFAGTPEPEAWTVAFDAPGAPPAGRAGLWGSPYSGTPIRFDDLRLEAVKE